MKTKQAQNSLLSEKQALAKQLQQVNAVLESLKVRIVHGEQQMKVSILEALKSTQEDRQLAINLENAKWELLDAEKELKWLKSAVSSSEKEYEQVQRKWDEIQKELDIERSDFLSLKFSICYAFYTMPSCLHILTEFLLPEVRERSLMMSS